MDALTESPGQYRPLSCKYDTIDRRYKFFKAKSAACLQMHYPLLKDEMGRHICQVVSFHRQSLFVFWKSFLKKSFKKQAPITHSGNTYYNKRFAG
uniref:Uncharacterized protein n=1 Tax=Wuchereria bancrofti TaxID=6293 RepID=A0A1I8EJT3_WUCBA